MGAYVVLSLLTGPRTESSMPSTGRMSISRDPRTQDVPHATQEQMAVHVVVNEHRG